MSRVTTALDAASRHRQRHHHAADRRERPRAEPPDPAYQQILHGVPAADLLFDELLYLPRNVRSHRLYGMSPVEQIALTVNIALCRDTATLDDYRSRSAT